MHLLCIPIDLSVWALEVLRIQKDLQTIMFQILWKLQILRNPALQDDEAYGILNLP